MEIGEQLNRAGTASPGNAATRFTKGKSGNPKGRPRKVEPIDDPRAGFSTAPWQELARAAAYRPVRVRTDEGTVDMSAIEAGYRELSLKAARGDRQALTALTQLMVRADAPASPAKPAQAATRGRSAGQEPIIPAIAAAEEYKAVWTRILLDAAEVRAVIEPPVPHPDAILIARVQGSVFWPGATPGETLSLNSLAERHARMVAELPERRREIDAMPEGYAKLCALCDWCEANDARRMITRHLPRRYYVDPELERADRCDGFRESRSRQQAEQRRLDHEWRMEEAREEAEAEAEAEAAEALVEAEIVAEPLIEAEAVVEAIVEEAGVAEPEAEEPDALPDLPPPPEVREALGYKQIWEAALAEAGRIGFALKPPVPHPDDVIVDAAAGTLAYRVPVDPDEGATLARALEGLEQVRVLETQYRRDLCFTDHDDLPAAERKRAGAATVAQAMSAAWGKWRAG